MSEPVTRQEQLLSAIATGGDIISPITREEMYLAYMAGDTSVVLPEPITRKEQFLYQACLNGGGGGGGTEITDGIVVKARDADGYATDVDFYGTAVQTYQFYCSSRTTGPFKNMARIVFKNAVTAINAFAFSATGITQLPDLSHVSELTSSVFRKCTLLSGSISLPTITRIAAEVFRECSGITAITAENAAFAGENAFGGCTALQTAHLPKCATLNTYVFSGDTALTNVQIGSIGNAVTSCVNTSFKGCAQTGLTITAYTTGTYADTLLTNIRNGATNATIIIKASEDTTYNDVVYAAGETMITSTVEATT